MKTEFEKVLRESLVAFEEGSSLSKAVSYALLSGGKRIRPLLVLQIAKALGKEVVFDAALSVEYFHTASLIADDMPCMDDDEVRRGMTCLHIKYGEATALLASYALITAAFERIHQAAGKNL